MKNALRFAAGEAAIVRDGAFYFLPGKTAVPIRNRSDAACATVRRPEMIPPREIAAAVLEIVGIHLGVELEETIIEVARLLGFKSTSPQLKEVIEGVIHSMVEQEGVQQRGSKLFVK